jgi:hypothetical protein
MGRGVIRDREGSVAFGTMRGTTTSTVRVPAKQEYGTWLNVGQKTRRPAAHLSRDGGIWRGPSDAAWMTRLLHGAPPPRPSAAMPSEALVAHG